MNPWEVFLPLKKPGKAGRGLRRLLLMTFTIQTLLIVLWDIRLPIPSFLVKNLEEITAKEGLILETTEATFSLSGKIQIENARIHASVGNLPTLAFAKRLEARLRLGSMLFGRLYPVNASIEDGWFLASPQDGFAPSFEKCSGHLHTQGDILLFTGEAKVGMARLDIRGSWPIGEWFRSDKRYPPEDQSIFLKEDFPNLHAEVVSWVNEAKDTLAFSERPILRTHISFSKEKNLRLLAEAESVATGVGIYKSGPLRSETRFFLDTDRNLTGSFFLDARNLRREGKENNATLGRIIARLDGFTQSFEGERNLPRGVARLEDISFTGKFAADLPAVYLETLPLDEDTLSFFAGLGTGVSRITLAGITNPFANNVEGTLSLALQPKDFHSPTLQQWNKRGLLQTSQPVRATMGPMRFADGNFTGTPFSIATNELVVRGSPPAKYRIRGRIGFDGSVHAHDMYAKLGRSEVHGSFRQDWSNLDYRFLLEGTCMPTELNPWLRDWWDSIWFDFNFGHETPHGDFDIQGRWGSGGTHTTTYGSVRFGDLAYKDLPVEKGSLKVIVNREETRIAEIRLEQSKGEIEGELSFSRSQSGKPLVLGFDLHGDLHPTQCRRVFGPVAEKVLERFETNATVAVTALGNVLLAEGNGSASKDSNRFRLHANCTKPISYSGMPLEYLYLELNSSSYQTRIQPFEFGLAGGQGKGTLLFHEEENSSKLDVDLAIHKVNRAGFVKAMQLSNAFKEDSDTNSTKAGAPEGKDGVLDLSLHVKGQPENLWSFEGNGTLIIEDPSLGDVRIFGSLSDFLSNSSLPLPTGSFQFTRMNAPFTLAGRQATFQKLSLSGFTSLLVANGTVDLSEEILDFEARLHLLGNIPILSKLTQLVDPLSAIGNIKIGGTFKVPDWKIQIRPGKAPLEVLFPNGLPLPRKGEAKKTDERNR